MLRRDRPALFGKSELFENTGEVVSTEVTSIKAQEFLQDQLDIFNILRSFRALTAQLDELNFKNVHSSTLFYNVKERQQHLNIEAHFWDTVHSDLPWQLGEGVRTTIRDGDIRTNPRVPKQMLARHPRYKASVLVRDPFRCIYRRQGIIITLSTPSVGDHVVSNRIMPELAKPPNINNEVNEDTSGVGRIRHRLNSFNKQGKISGPEDFLVFLISEMVMDFHHEEYGGMISVWNAYRPIVRDLNSRRGSPFRRHETVNLVRQYVSCMDEISQIQEMCKQKIDLLKDLAVDNEKMHSSNKQHLAARLEGSIESIKIFNDTLLQSLTELRFSLQVLFQLKTIEQNEIAIYAESNNKAILVFTIVTIVFLPLSFFTSYFGMNLQGIANTDKTQRDFWAICGSITVFIVGLTIVFGFSERIYSFFTTIWQDGYVDERRGYRRELNQMVADRDYL